MNSSSFGSYSKSEDVDVSIIIVNWNAREFLRDCLESIYETIRKTTFEIIVVDNNSSDGSREMVDKKFSKVKLIHTRTNLGFAKANNIGINSSIGRYLCLINSDTKALENSIDLMISYMQQQPQIGILGPKVLNPDMTLQPNFRSFHSLWNLFCRALALDKFFPDSRLFHGAMMKFFKGNEIRTVDVLTGVCWLVRREALAKVGLLDERFFMYSEDFDWCKRYQEAGWKVVFYPDAQIIHYGGGSSSNSPSRFFIEMQYAKLRYWRKHHNRFSQLCFILLTLLHHVLRVIGWMIMPSARRDAGHKINRSLKYIASFFRLCVF